MSQDVSVFWFRRDLRLDDNHGLYRALKAGRPVLAIFIFDQEILGKLPQKDARVEFILHRLTELNAQLNKAGSALHVYHGSPFAVWRGILQEHRVRSIYCNEDYEPYAVIRDEAIAELAAQQNVNFYAAKDQVIFAKNDVVKEDGQPYKVFTPYSRRWKLKLKETGLESYPSQKKLAQMLKGKSRTLPTLKELGFEPSGIALPSGRVTAEKIKKYAKTRDLMGEPGTTRLGIHLRFGTLSIRKLVKWVQPLSDVFLNELIWREFFQQILYHFASTATKPFDARYENVKWLNNKKQFAAWCEGKTGYPVVDAAMHELNATGFMHNRARMVVASFLSKHLLIDWRWGER
ncbi:MAG: cryptochrome/photolyase family protein, partial [Bdellovibrionales bacterium]